MNSFFFLVEKRSFGKTQPREQNLYTMLGNDKQIPNIMKQKSPST